MKVTINFTFLSIDPDGGKVKEGDLRLRILGWGFSGKNLKIRGVTNCVTPLIFLASPRGL